MAAGIAIGALESHGIYAQTSRPVFMIEDNTVTNPDGFAKEFAPLARDSVKTYGGRHLAGACAAMMPVKSLILACSRVSSCFDFTDAAQQRCWPIHGRE
ncbi:MULTISPECIES: hypothetical protein [unclassified Bradyrhizobium]|uniref:hypothetical protein n=1 Tax=unclassified Bradyrhizobium TaxID=2631580 RepID=UPI0023041DB6|nr:hypothetical protein [Bradyrhizobium sp. CCBAU 45321]